jgi:hypothetical protein
MYKGKNTIQRIEHQLADSLSSIKSIALQLVEFVLFMYGLIALFMHAIK